MIRSTVGAALALLVALPALAQYPDRPLNIIAAYPAGGMVDIVARALSEGMKKRYPNGVVVVNRPGAGGSVGMSEVTRAKPDGYTIILTPLSALVIVPQVSDVAYRTPDDYEPFINVVSYYPMLAVRTESPLKSGPDFVAEAKANPGKLRVGSPGEGTSSHLNLEELMFKAEIQVTHVPFAGLGPVGAGAARRAHRRPGRAAGRGQAAGRRQAHAPADGVPGEAP